ncbi:UTRA domain-containing protein [Sneathiella limimaris]|uniref:UTRA domain-containing protein n=1 Tax=Sneathiella limimaris TaxID=1964213 RepID=UPI00146D038D|nr:UTRA domain-containing protein [Sneathiella limimaris]
MKDTPNIRNIQVGAEGSPQPLYEQVKNYVLSHIDSGAWSVNAQIPSEHSLVEELNMSRMTIHRALRELTKDGYLTRIQGVGTFVAPQKNRGGEPALLYDIRETIEAVGNIHRCIPQFFQIEPVNPEFAVKLGMKEDDPVIRSYFIHQANGLPILLEDRYTVPDLMPDMLEVNFTEKTIDSYFRQTCTMLSHENQITAITANQEVQHFLDTETLAPCVQITRRSWQGTRILSYTRMIIPAGRLQLKC